MSTVFSERFAMEATLWLNLFGYGYCDACRCTWDFCRCPDRDERFSAEYERRRSGMISEKAREVRALASEGKE